MKRQLSLVALFFFGITAYAQDVDFGAFNDAGNLLGPAAPAARGAAPARGAGIPAPAPDRLVRLREALLKADAPLTKEQETELNKIIDTEIPVMRKTIQTHGQQMMAERGVSQTPPSPASAAPASAPPATGASTPAPSPAARGAATPPAGAPPNAALLAALAARNAPPPSSRVPAEVLDALEVEMRQMNDALFMKIATAPALKPAQQTVLTKMSRDQIRSRGGFDALRIAMEDAGAPFTAEQTPKVQALFDEQKVARANLAKESQGTPDPAKLKQLERETLTKVVGLLVPAQRTALLAMLRAQQ
jgi:hypothetical protein